MSKKLLVIGSNSIHVHNFIELIKDYFDDILLLTNKKDEAWDVKSMEIDFRLRVNGLKNYKNLKKIINDFKPTNVHIHQVNTPAFLTILALKGYTTQIILTAWGSDILINPKKSLLQKWKVKYILNHVDIVTADSDTVLYEANKLANNTLKTYNINFGIKIPDCTTKKENIIYSNRLHEELYNIDKIILSFSKFVKSNPSWKLIIAGRGGNTDKLKELVKTLELDSSVEFIGWVDSKINFENYCKAKIYVSIPNSDSVSLSLVEAIVANCIVFVSNLPANKEILSSEIGFEVDKLESIDFSCFETLDMQKFQEKREKIVHKFSKKINKLDYINLYKKVSN